MEIFNRAKPEAARQAQKQAHQRREKAGTRNQRKPASRLQYLKDERVYNKQRAADNREILASRADLFLYNLKKPKLTARRLQIAQVKEAADRASIARARDPQRVRARQMRHVNMITHSILKERGYR